MWKSILRRRRGREPLDRYQVCVVSYPKTGRTWLRMMVGKYLCLRYELDEADVLDTPRLTETAGLPVTGFVHGGSALAKRQSFLARDSDTSGYESKRVVLLTRSVEDAMVSAYFQVTDRLRIYAGTISDFLRHDCFGVERYLMFYKHWERIQNVPEHFRLLSYEDMHANAGGALRNVLEAICVVDIDDQLVQEAVDFASFRSMQQMEKTRTLAARAMRATDPRNPNSRKVRRGLVGGYVDYLGPEDLGFIRQRVAIANCGFVRTLSDSSLTAPNAA